MMRKSSGFAGRSSSGDRQSLSGALRVQKDNIRKSTLPQTQAQGGRKSLQTTSLDRNSIGGRASIGVSGGGGSAKKSMARYSLYGTQQRRFSRGSGMGIRTHTGQTKDPRNISNRSNQQKAVKTLLQFLTENQFPHVVSTKVLQSPTNVEFMKIFEFIWGFLEPGGKIVRDDIPKLFKQIGYPFMITKSAMMTVGSPHTWPTILGALIWLVELIKLSMLTDIDDICFPMGDFDDFDSVPETKILFDYVEKTYLAFLHGHDTFEDYDEKLCEMIKTRGMDLESLEKENRLLATELEFLEKNTDKLKTLQEAKALRRLDDDKFVNYFEKVDAHKQALEKQLMEAENELQEVSTEAESDDSRRQHLLSIFEDQKFSQSDIERIKMNQKELQRQIKENERAEEEIDQEVWQREMVLSKRREMLESKCNEYHKLAQHLKLIPSTAENAHGVNYEINPSYTTYMGSHFNDTIKPSLLLLKKQCSESLRNKERQRMKEEDSLEQYVDLVAENEEEVRMKESRVKRMEEELECKRQVNQREYQQYQDELDTLQREIMEQQNYSQLSVQEAEKDLKDTQKKVDIKRSELTKVEEAYVKFMMNTAAKVTNHIEICQERLDTMLSESESELKAVTQEKQATDEWLKQVCDQFSQIKKH